MIQLLKSGHDSLETITLEELKASARPIKDALWIDLFQPTEEEELFVEKTLGVDLPSQEDMMEIAESSRLFEDKGALYLSCWVLCFDSPIPLNASVSFVITGKQFVSIRHSDHHGFRVFSHHRNRLQTRQFRSHDEAFVELLDALAGHIASNLRLVEQDLNSLSLEIFSEQKAQQERMKKTGLKRIVQRLGKRNSLVASLRESSVSLANLTPFFISYGEGWLKPNVMAQLNTLERDITSLRQYDAELSSEINFLLDSTVGLISYEQNQAMKILSVAAVLVAFI